MKIFITKFYFVQKPSLYKIFMLQKFGAIQYCRTTQCTAVYSSSKDKTLPDHKELVTHIHCRHLLKFGLQLDEYDVKRKLVSAII